jgi:hypothetical protein
MRSTSYVVNVLGTNNVRAVDAMGTSRWWILAASATSTLDPTVTVGPGTVDIVDVVGTSNRRASGAVGNVIDVMETSSRRVGSGMTCIFSNYRLRIEILVNFMKLELNIFFVGKIVSNLLLHCISWFLWLSNMFISMSWRFQTHSATPWQETSSPKWCSTQAVEERTTTTQRSGERWILRLLHFVIWCLNCDVMLDVWICDIKIVMSFDMWCLNVLMCTEWCRFLCLFWRVSNRKGRQNR